MPSETRLGGEAGETRSEAEGEELSSAKCTLFSGEGSRTLCSAGRGEKQTEAAEHEGKEESEGAGMAESGEGGRASCDEGEEGGGEYIWRRSVRVSVIVEGSVGCVVV